MAATRFTLELDGQTLDYRHGPVRSQPVQWPGPAPGAAAVTIEDRTGVQTATARFRGLGPGSACSMPATLKAETDVRIDAAFQSGGHQAAVIIEPTSIRNPYQGRECVNSAAAA